MYNIMGCMTGLSLMLMMINNSDSDNIRKMQFKAKTPDEAKIWQKQAREKLFELMMGGSKPKNVPLNPKIIKRVEVPGENYFLEEITIDSLTDRKVHVWLAMQKDVPKESLPAMLALHGHGGTALEIVNGESLYWYGKAFAQKGYAVISLEVSEPAIINNRDIPVAQPIRSCIIIKPP